MISQVALKIFSQFIASKTAVICVIDFECLYRVYPRIFTHINAITFI